MAVRVSESYRARMILLKILLSVTGVAFQVASRYVPELRREIAQWRDGFVFTFRVLPDGPFLSIRKDGDRTRALAEYERDPDIAILCKSLDAGLMCLTGKIGAHTAVVQRRVIIQGNIAEAMKVQRAMTLVQMYVFPGVVLNKILRRPLKWTLVQMWIKAKVIAGLAVGLLWTARKP